MERKSVYVSKRTGEKKIKTIVYLPEEVFRKANELAARLYPNLRRGAFSQLVTDALKFFIAEHTQVRAKINPRPSTRELMQRIYDLMMIDYDLSPPPTIRNVKLKYYVARARGIKDPRSIASWIYKLYVDGLIKPLNTVIKDWRDCKENGIVWELVFTPKKQSIIDKLY